GGCPRRTPCGLSPPSWLQARSRRYRRRGPPGTAAAVTEIIPGGLSDLGRLFLTSGEAIAAAAHSCEELLEVDLEGGQDLVGVVLRPEPDLPFRLARVLDYLLGGALGLLVDLLVGDQTGLLVAGLLDHALSLALGLGEHYL